jgi:hypothetical protein
VLVVVLEGSDFCELIRCELIRRAFKRRAHQPAKATFLEDDDEHEEELPSGRSHHPRAHTSNAFHVPSGLPSVSSQQAQAVQTDEDRATFMTHDAER